MFEQLGGLWASGKHGERPPDHVRLKRTANADAGAGEARLRMCVCPIIGNHAMSDFEGPAGVTLAEAETEEEAGVHRPQSFEASGARIPLRARDLRATRPSSP
ncbi:hypothetical protein [Sorangium sp. So ce204]|uniref:hypothetical protein n=1 Tax=Sorangium sp. So ce204 TaxID=3133288 RepID=UPI003F6375BE